MPGECVSGTIPINIKVQSHIRGRNKHKSCNPSLVKKHIGLVEIHLLARRKTKCQYIKITAELQQGSEIAPSAHK